MKYNNTESNIEVILPAIRASATKLMSRDYKLTQQKIAVLLGLTQAAVSKYINNKYSFKIQRIEKKFDKKQINEFIKYKIDKKEKRAKEIVCKLCKKTYDFCRN